MNTELLIEPQPAGRFRALFILSICIVLSMTTWFSATAVIPQLQSIWNLTPTLSAWLTIGVQLGFVIGAIGSSIVSLSDVISSKKLMIYGSIGAAAANLGLLLVESAYLAIFFRLMTGVFLALVYPPSLKLISTWFRRGRGLALGALVGSITLGSAAPHFINAIGGLGWELVVIATTIGIGLSFTKARTLEGAGASKVGSVFIYILVATIGMSMNVMEIFHKPGLFAVGLVWMMIHVGLMFIVAKIIRAPYFFLAVGSKANIGGAASAPVVAAAFHPALAPVGVLLAVLGYALGTYGAYICGLLMQASAGVY